jgi:hypothetical protein
MRLSPRKAAHVALDECRVVGNPGNAPVGACDFFNLFAFSAHLNGCFSFFSTPQQNRHPERSAAQMYLITDGLWRAVGRACPERSRGNPGDACWPLRFEAFQPQTTGEIKKVTSSERSAAQICRVTHGLWRRVEGTPAMLFGRCSWEFFNHKLKRTLKKSQAPTEAERGRLRVRLVQIGCRQSNLCTKGTASAVP